MEGHMRVTAAAAAGAWVLVMACAHQSARSDQNALLRPRQYAYQVLRVPPDVRVMWIVDGITLPALPHDLLADDVVSIEVVKGRAMARYSPVAKDAVILVAT